MKRIKKSNFCKSLHVRGKGVCKYRIDSFILNLMNVKPFVLMVLMFYLSGVLSAQTSLNDQKLDSAINTKDFSFIVTGHIHGDGTNLSGYPASTFLGNLDEIKQLNPAFIWFTGDVFLDIKRDLPNYRQSLFEKVDFPLFDAVGNHDLTRDYYQEKIGNTWFSFAIGDNLFITLDTEADDSKIIGEQFDFLKGQLEEASQMGIKNVLIASHRPIWAETNPEFTGLFSGNTRSVFGDNFVEDILPMLNKFSQNYKIYWFSGSMGSVPVSFFYHSEYNITYIQTAIRNIERDAILKVNMRNNELSFETISLTGQKLKPLEFYNMAFWKDYKKPEKMFNYRLVPLYIKLTITHRYFWYGMGVMLLLAFVIGLIRKRVSKAK